MGVTSLQFRGLLFAGAIPASIVLLAVSMESADQPSTIRSEAAEQARQDAERKEAFRDLRHWRVLIGTAGTWFLFDVAFYGTVIFQPTILENVFGKGQSLEGLAGHAVMMCALGSLGLIAGLFALRC